MSTFNLICSDKTLNLCQHGLYWKQALAFTKGLPNRRYDANKKIWSTNMTSETVLAMLPKTETVAETVKKFPPNKYQRPIVDHIVTSKPGSKTLVVADAGTGKTATISMLVDFTRETVAGVAFNSSVKTELIKRGVNGFTFNSLGFRAIGRKRVNNSHYADYLKSILDKDEFYLISPIVKLFDLSRNMMSKKYADLALEYAVDFKSEDEQRIYNLVDNLHMLNSLNQSEIDFTDQIYLTVKNRLPLPYFDILAIDECQDLNPLRCALIQEYARQHPQTKIMYVGDDKQAINGWSGTIDNAMDVLSQGAEVFPLKLTYRNAQAIIEYVKECHPNVTTETASTVQGSVNFIGAVQMNPDNGDMVICKHNAPLVKIALSLLKLGKSVTVKGRDISGYLTYVLSKSGVKTFNDMPEKLNNWLMDIGSKVSKATYDNYADNVDCILAIAENCNSMDDLYLTINKLFSDSDGQIVLSSIHRSKGLESKNVYIIANEDKLKLSYGELDGSQDKNLSYVALTRAIENLYIVE